MKPDLVSACQSANHCDPSSMQFVPVLKGADKLHFIVLTFKGLPHPCRRSDQRYPRIPEPKRLHQFHNAWERCRFLTHTSHRAWSALHEALTALRFSSATVW